MDGQTKDTFKHEDPFILLYCTRLTVQTKHYIVILSTYIVSL